MTDKVDYIKLLWNLQSANSRLLQMVERKLAEATIHGVTAVQALMMFQIGDQELSASDLSRRGYYHGSNVSYNLNKMVENGYVNRVTSKLDRRKVILTLTPKGHDIATLVDQLVTTKAQECVSPTVTIASDLLWRFAHS